MDLQVMSMAYTAVAPTYSMVFLKNQQYWKIQAMFSRLPRCRHRMQDAGCRMRAMQGAGCVLCLLRAHPPDAMRGTKPPAVDTVPDQAACMCAYACVGLQTGWCCSVLDNLCHGKGGWHLAFARLFAGFVLADPLRMVERTLDLAGVLDCLECGTTQTTRTPHTTHQILSLDLRTHEV